jgi:type I restriction enzyme R subunit
VFETARGGLIKKVAKNHQYLGVNKAIAQMVKLRESGDREAAKKLGVFWHTQGSGKSLSMVFFTQKVLRKVPGKWTFVMVTDRAELDDQIYKTFKATGAITGAEVQATSAEHLKATAAGRPPLRLQPDPEIPHRQGRGLSEDVRPGRHHRHHRRGAPQPVRRVRAEHAQRPAQCRLPRLHRHPADPGEEERTREVFGDYVSRCTTSPAPSRTAPRCRCTTRTAAPSCSSSTTT